MFFWMMLASFMGIVAFGNWQEKSRDQKDFIAPVYEAMALSAYQQHISVEQGFLDAMRLNPTAVNTYLNGVSDGIVPLAVSGTDYALDPVNATNAVFPYIQTRLPPGYKSQNNTRTYLICIPKSQNVSSGTAANCGNPDIVKYIITIRQIPARYDGANKMAALTSISQATAYSRFVGMLQKAPAPLYQTAEGTIKHQPLGAQYHILSSGYAPVNSVYIPNYALCNFPMNNDATSLLGELAENKSFIAALTLVAGLDTNENLDLPTADVTCPAISSSGG